MDAIVIAGGIPNPDEPLYPYTQGKPKALLDVAGKPMAQWVLDALEQAQTIDRIVIVGLEADSGIHCTKIAAYIESEGSILQNIRAGVNKVLEFNPTAVMWRSSRRISRGSFQSTWIGWCAPPCKPMRMFITMSSPRR